MDTENKYARYSMLSVKIYLNGITEEFIGSGTLFVRGVNEDALVLTAAHIFPEIGVDKNYKLILVVEGGHRIERFFLDKNSRDEDTLERIYYLDSYNKTNLTSDAAILTIPWEDWMVDYQSFVMRDSCMVNSVIGWGFPQAMEMEDALKGKQSLLTPIEGNINVVYENGKSLLDYKSYGHWNRSRREEMQGFSGTALFSFMQGKGVYVGCISAPAGHENAGGRALISNASLFKTIMKENGLLPSIPKSFRPFQALVVQQFEKFEKEERKYIRIATEKLINQFKLTPQHCIKNSSENMKRCKKDISSTCPLYWKGQLIRAVFFCTVLGCNVESFESYYVNHKGHSEPVFFEYICTEQSVVDYVQFLLCGKYSTNGFSNKGTIFLWNGTCNAGRYYWDSIPRKNVKRIINDITDLRESSAVRYEDLMISDFVDGGTYGDCIESNYVESIVDYEVFEPNFAFIGMGELIKTTFQESACKTELMKMNLINCINRIWEI